MPCIHSLDEIYCPICRIIKYTAPKYQLLLKKNNLKPENPFFKQYSNEKEDFLKHLTPKKGYFNPDSINVIPKPNLLNELPNFENKMFLDRLKEIEITKSDNFGIFKKIYLASPEIKFDKEE